MGWVWNPRRRRKWAGARSLCLGVVLTGGTVGSTVVEDGDDAVVVLRPGTASDRSSELDLIRAVAPSDVELDLRVRRPLDLLSEDLSPGDWVTIGAAVEDLVCNEAVSGVLVLHGTDTMAYTAAALSFALAGTAVPVVLTGANVPPDQRESDAGTNIRDALVALGALGEGVYISFAGFPGRHSYVHRGTCARKVRGSGQTFFSINCDPVGRVSTYGFRWLSRSVAAGDGLEKFSADRDDSGLHFDERVLFVRVYPGINLDDVYETATSGGTRGAVVELYPSSTGPTRPESSSLPRFVERLRREGIPVVGVLAEAPDLAANLYESSRALREAGMTFVEGVLPETAVVKLMWALGQTGDPRAVEEIMQTPVAGEMGRLHP